MALNLKKKQEIVDKVKKTIQSALSMIIADFRGITVDNMTALRRESRRCNVYIHVIRNTLLHRAIKGTNFECLQKALTGPILIACSMEHPGAAARLLKEFTKTNTKFEIKAAAFEGKLISISKIDKLANLPATLEDAILLFIETIKGISIGKLLCTLDTIRIRKIKEHN